MRDAMCEAIEGLDDAALARLPETGAEVARSALIAFADGYLGEDLPRLIQRPPHAIAGEPLPGNRGLHDNPDTFYRLVPLDGRSDFVLEGEVGDAPATIFEISALSSSWQTLGNLTKDDLGIRPGSKFRLHVAREGGARADHFLQIAEDAEMLLIRETLADWATQAPCALTIENRVTRGGERESDDEGYVESAAARVAKWFDQSVDLVAAPLSQPPNVFPEPVITNQQGKLVTMAYSIGHFAVPAGEVLVLDIDPGSAPYVIVPITNVWGTTGPRPSRGASWNSHQAAPNSDGSFTCVLSVDDPGVHNWLDPEGQERGFLFLRWAGLPADRPPERAPGLATRVVPFDALRETLPPETRWVDRETRNEILSVREREHTRRYEGPWTEIRVRRGERDG